MLPFSLNYDGFELRGPCEVYRARAGGDRFIVCVFSDDGTRHFVSLALVAGSESAQRMAEFAGDRVCPYTAGTHLDPDA